MLLMGGEEQTDSKNTIGGVDVDEVLSMYDSQRQNQADFTGYSPEVDNNNLNDNALVN